MASTATATSTAMGARAPKRAGAAAAVGGTRRRPRRRRRSARRRSAARRARRRRSARARGRRRMGRRARPSSRPSRRSRSTSSRSTTITPGKTWASVARSSRRIPRLARGGDGRLRVRRRRRRRLRPRGRPTAHSRPPRATQKPPEVRGVRQGVHQPGAARGAQSRQGAPQGDPSGGVRQTRRRSRECRPGAREAAPGCGGGGGRAGPPRPAPGPPPPPGVQHCALCRKTFTSDAQLAEHNRGKWHLMRLSGELAPSRKPYGA